MRLVLSDDDGTMLDSVDVTVQDWLSDQRTNPHSLLSLLNPGTNFLRDALRDALSNNKDG